MFLDIIYIILKSVSCPSIPFMGNIFLALLETYIYQVLQGTPHLMSFVGVVELWAGVVIMMGYSMSSSVVIGIFVPIILGSCKFMGINLGLLCMQLLGENQYCFLRLV